MNIVVTTAALYPDRSRIHLLDESANRCGIPLEPFGIGKPYSNWRQMLMEDTLVALDSFGTEFSHVLYVDAADSLFLAPMEEIIWKYEDYGSPPLLISADSPSPILDKHYGVNAGGFIAEIQFFTELMRRLSRIFVDEGDYQTWLNRSGKIDGMWVDHARQIFQSMDECHLSIQAVGRRVVNTVTAQWPCVLHFRGGYSDPHTGRDYRLLPWCEKLWGKS